MNRALFLLILAAAVVVPSGAGRAAPAGRADTPETEPQRLSRILVPEIQRTMAEGRIPSCAVALVRGDAIVWTGAFGYSNLWARTPARPETVYLIGSTFKTMAMTGLVRLMDEGKFRLDDPVAPLLGDLKIRDEPPDRPVTFRHLLTHTAGLPSDFGPFLVWGDASPPSLASYLQKSLKLKNPPLAMVEYSNIGFTLIAFLIEKLSGQPFRSYIISRVFEPAGLTDTGFIPRPDMVERLAVPYIVSVKTGAWTPVHWQKASVWPAGIVYGTVLDQARWLIVNLNGGLAGGRRLVSEAAFAEIMTRQYSRFAGPIGHGWLNETTGFGLAWWISERNGAKLFAHSGSVSGYTAFLAGNLERRTGFAVLSNGNQSHPYFYRLALAALDALEPAPAAE
ncbi:MAG: beta-lactamase family protein [Candidatus Aminicenantes bacterium]|nr:beta-lactamase family protein [Candidatus Aminicenantes bacterium]